jgi:para-aminobenzoate synthetase component I
MIAAPTAEDWKRWQGEFSHLPAVFSCRCDKAPAHWHAWWESGRCSALLETGKAGRFTILAPRIEQLLVTGENSAQLLRTTPARTHLLETLHLPPLEALRRYTRRFTSPRLTGGLPLVAGWIGFFSYDLVRVLEKLPSRARDDLGLPMGSWGLVDRCYLLDHHERMLHCVVTRPVKPGLGTAEVGTLFSEAWQEAALMRDEWEDRSRRPPPAPSPAEGHFDGVRRPRVSFSREEFVAAVLRVQEWIRSGDTYQVNLSVRETRPLHATPEAVYEELRRINPSPYMALLRLPGFTLVSGSPELLVRVRDHKLEARPIAGTRPRGDNDQEDEALTRDLIGNSKERAEHLMLVDLIRNDLGRVSTFGSVRVSEFMTVENYSHVMHIVSHIEGELAAGKDLFDVISATFPGGTITGAPKVRTMEIIEELEPVRRGPYTGSIGWIGFDGEMELNITIRTLVAHKGQAHVQAGAGIVIDSHPEREYEESLNKAKALWAAVAAAEARLAPTPAGT